MEFEGVNHGKPACAKRVQNDTKRVGKLTEKNEFTVRVVYSLRYTYACAKTERAKIRACLKKNEMRVSKSRSHMTRHVQLDVVKPSSVLKQGFQPTQRTQRNDEMTHAT